jgi:catechol 2,3-dioxygenase-like lactoylglutathione lyase family enzyme
MLTGIFKKQAPKHPINPRFRAYGKARLDIARRAATRSDWDQLWKEPAFPFPFDWGEWWKQCIEYKVDDFPAEVGFFTDILGLPVVAFDPNYAMFTSPARDFFLAVVPALEAGKSTPPDALRIQFMVADIFKTVQELERRGIVFEQNPQPCELGSSMFITYFRTPHGLSVDLWGIVPESEGPGIVLEDEEGEFEFDSQKSEVSGEVEEPAYPWEQPAAGSSLAIEEEDEDEEELLDEEELRFEVEEKGEEETEESGDSSQPEQLNFMGPREATIPGRSSWSFTDTEFEEPEEEDDDDSYPPIEYVYEDDL